jgi:hypothetical protein
MNTQTNTARDTSYFNDGPASAEPEYETLQCKQCGELAKVEGLTEVQLELVVCGDECAYAEVRDMGRKIEKLTLERNSARYQIRMQEAA